MFLNGDLKTKSHITSSGNISASGLLFASSSTGNYSNIVVQDTASGRFYTTASSAIATTDTFKVTGQRNGNSGITGSLHLTGSTSDLRVDGTIGIGTAAPTANNVMLHIKSNHTGLPTAIIEGDDGDSNANLEFKNTDISWVTGLTGGGYSDSFLIRSSSATALYPFAIDPSAGGIGTAPLLYMKGDKISILRGINPTANLHVSGNIVVDGPNGNISASGYISASHAIFPNLPAIPQTTAVYYDRTTGQLTYDFSPSSLSISGAIDAATGSLLNDYSLLSSSTQISDFDVFVENTLTSSLVFNSSTSSFVQNSSTSSFVVNSQTGSFVINSQTGSFLLNTTDTLTGDLTVTGTITAQEFHTEFVSASIIFESGSTKFGDTLDDVHNMTGSLNVTGSVTIDGGIFTAKGPNEVVARVERTTGSGFTVLDIKDGVGTSGNSVIRFSDTAASKGQINYEHADDSLRITTNASEQLRITSDGKVGIGIASPASGLHISSSEAIKTIIEGDDGGNLLRLKRTDQGKFFDLSLEGNDLRFNPGTLDNTQNVLFGVSNGSAKVASRVGIGQPSPQSELDISGSIIISGPGHITASGNISASGYISASQFIGNFIGSLLGTASTASYVENAQTASYVETSQTASYILANNIDQPFTNITATGNISASGELFGNKLFIDNLGSIDTNNGDTGRLFIDGDITAIEVGRSSAPLSKNISLFGPVTASGNISASGLLYASASSANGNPYQTVMMNTSSGEFFYTGSYGAAGLSAVLSTALTANLTVGGVTSGETFTQGSTIEALLRDMLITYQEPTLSNFLIKEGGSTISTSTRDVGASFTCNTASFSAQVDSPNGDLPESASISVTGASIGSFSETGPNDIQASNTFAFSTARNISKASAGSVTFTLNTDSRTTGDTQTATKTFNFRFRNYLAASSTVISDGATLQTVLNNGVVQSPFDTNKSWTATCGAANDTSGNFTYIIYPASYGDLSGIIQDGATPVLGAFTKLSDQTANNNESVSLTWRIYKSNADQAFANGTTLAIS